MGESTFGDLRSLLQRAPSPLLWEDLCALMDLSDAEQRDSELIPYALSHLKRWPWQLRVAPPRWLRAAEQGEASCLQLVCALDLEPWFHEFARLAATLDALPHPPTIYRLSCGDLWSHALEALDQSASFGSLKRLEHTAYGMAEAQPLLQSLADCKHIRLSALQLHSSQHSASSWQLLGNAEAFSALEELDVRADGLIDERNISALADGSALTRLRSLGLAECFIGAAAFKQLVTARGWPSALERLDLWGTTLIPSGPHFSDLAVDHLQAAPMLKTLKSLILDAQPAPGEDIMALIARLAQEQAAQPKLKRLSLSFNQLDDDALTQLWSSGFTALERLSLSDTDVTLSRSEQLPASTGLPKLRILSLERNELRGDMLGALLGANVPKLEQLRLGQTLIGDQGLMALTRGPQRWRGLWLPRTGISAQATAEALNSPSFSALSDLDLSMNELDDHIIQSIIEAGLTKTLEQLNLARAGLSHEALVGLAIGGMARLRALDLSSNALNDNDRGIIAFVMSPSAQRLHTLKLGHRTWSLAGIKAVAMSPMLRRLEQLDLDLTTLDDAQRQLIERSPYLPKR